MVPKDEDTWEAEYWDDYRKEFGTDAYMVARYGMDKPGDLLGAEDSGPTYSDTKACRMCGSVHPC